MKLVKPVQFREAVRKLGERSPIASALNSEQWARVPLGLRDRAFFSSMVENTQFLQRSKDLLGDFLSSAREEVTPPTGSQTTALAVGSRAKFIEEARRFAIAEGMGPLDPKDIGTIKDIQSERRLALIYDVQTTAAYEYGGWEQANDPDVLDEFPAQRFIREVEVKEPRDIHQHHENEVRLKSDIGFWTALNRDFGVPWGPWGWGCGHGVEDVDRAEAEQLGLIQPGEAVKSPDVEFNDRLRASTRNLDPDLLQWLADQFGDQIEIDQVNQVVKWSPKIARTAPAITVPKAMGQDTMDSLVAEHVRIEADLVLSERASADLAGERATQRQQLVGMVGEQRFADLVGANQAGDISQIVARWSPKERALANQWSQTRQQQRAAADKHRELQAALQALPERARTAIEIPRVERASVPFDPALRSSAQKTAAAGGEIISRYTAAELIQRLAPVKVVAIRGRAYYSSGTIHIRAGDDSTAAHEIMHGIETQNPGVLRKAADFLFKRGAGEVPQKLSTLLPGRRYGPREIAFDDKWKELGGHPYSGKVYSYKGEQSTPQDLTATEVLTMGIERLHGDPLRFYMTDHEYFRFVVNTLRNQ